MKYRTRNNMVKDEAKIEKGIVIWEAILSKKIIIENNKLQTISVDLF